MPGNFCVIKRILFGECAIVKKQTTHMHYWPLHIHQMAHSDALVIIAQQLRRYTVAIFPMSYAFHFREVLVYLIVIGVGVGWHHFWFLLI